MSKDEKSLKPCKDQDLLSGKSRNDPNLSVTTEGNFNLLTPDENIRRIT